MSERIENREMKIYEITERAAVIDRLLEIWESSVRATHLFLSESEIMRIKGYVPTALNGVSHLVIAENDEGEPLAFMGAQNGRLEMLFVSADERGQGIGKSLLSYGIEKLGVRELTVNEQNPQAVGFYQHAGFEIYKRTDHDEEGGAYPLLYMRLGRGQKE